MYRLFTLHQATRLLPVVDDRLGEMQDAASELLRLRRNAQGRPATSVEAHNTSQEMSFLLATIHGNKAELDRLGVSVRNVETGEVEFASQLGGEVVCLTWARGQDAITHYHALSGDTAVRPLPEPRAAPEAIPPA